MTWRNRRRRKQSRIIRRVMRRAFETAAAELFRESYLSFYTTKRELKPLDVSGLILIEDFDYKQGIPSVPIWQPALDMPLLASRIDRIFDELIEEEFDKALYEGDQSK